MVDYKRECPGCKIAFTANRLNQKFCSSRCKAHFHNHLNRETFLERKATETITAGVNTILWTNRELLLANSGTEVDFGSLIQMGFKNNFITRFEMVGENRNRFYCYDMAYEYTSPQTIKIYPA